MKRRIILASGSSARREVLAATGLPFEVRPSAYEEIMDPSAMPEELAVRLALGKARAVAAKNPDAIIIAADSFVVLDGRYLGKPCDEEEARAMLKEECGRTQDFVTGLAVIDAPTGREFTDCDLCRETLASLSDEEIAAYVATGEPLGKAGAYAIQGRGALFIERIEGSPAGIAGLPLHKLYPILRELGINPLA